MANFIGLVYATLKDEGIDTKGMSTDEAVKKFKELKGGESESPDDVKKKLNGEKKEGKEEQKPEDVKKKLGGEKSDTYKGIPVKDLIEHREYWSKQGGNELAEALKNPDTLVKHYQMTQGAFNKPISNKVLSYEELKERRKEVGFSTTENDYKEYLRRMEQQQK